MKLGSVENSYKVQECKNVHRYARIDKMTIMVILIIWAPVQKASIPFDHLRIRGTANCSNFVPRAKKEKKK